MISRIAHHALEVVHTLLQAEAGQICAGFSWDAGVKRCETKTAQGPCQSFCSWSHCINHEVVVLCRKPWTKMETSALNGLVPVLQSGMMQIQGWFLGAQSCVRRFQVFQGRTSVYSIWNSQNMKDGVPSWCPQDYGFNATVSAALLFKVVLQLIYSHLACAPHRNVCILRKCGKKFQQWNSSSEKTGKHDPLRLARLRTIPWNIKNFEELSILFGIFSVTLRSLRNPKSRV